MQKQLLEGLLVLQEFEKKQAESESVDSRLPLSVLQILNHTIAAGAVFLADKYFHLLN